MTPLDLLADADDRERRRTNGKPVMSFQTSTSPNPFFEPFDICALDERADGGVRHIRMSPRGIAIERQLNGVKMHLVVPIRGYEGVVLTCDEQRFCRIALVHQDEDLTIELYQAAESPAVLAIWRGWAEFFAKPALYHEPPVTRGDLSGMGWALPRRRGLRLDERRPRFLKRRRCGHLSRVGR
jgi:hypothetical protein